MLVPSKEDLHKIIFQVAYLRQTAPPPLSKQAIKTKLEKVSKTSGEKEKEKWILDF